MRAHVFLGSDIMLPSHACMAFVLILKSVFPLHQNMQLFRTSCLAVLALAVRGDMSDELYQPPILVSADGVLDVVLTVKLGTSLSDTRLSPLYNGQPMGPTIKVKPGDVLTLTLDNKLAPSSEEEKAMMATVKDPNADAAEVTKLYNRLQDDGNIYGALTLSIALSFPKISKRPKLTIYIKVRVCVFVC